MSTFKNSSRHKLKSFCWFKILSRKKMQVLKNGVLQVMEGSRGGSSFLDQEWRRENRWEKLVWAEVGEKYK
jgi:hypothetical protein